MPSISTSVDSEVDLERDGLHGLIHLPSEDAEDLLGLLDLLELPSKDRIHKQLEEQFLTPSDSIPSHWLSTYQIHWKSQLSIPSLLPLAPASPPTKLELIRSGLDGKVTGYIEVSNPKQASGISSASLDRAFGPATAFIRGRTGNSPFLPGGLEDVVKADGRYGAEPDQDVMNSRLLSIPPGFPRGLRLPGEQGEDMSADDDSQTFEFNDDLGVKISDSTHVFSSPTYQSSSNRQVRGEIDDLLPSNRNYFLPGSSTSRLKTQPRIPKRDWAHVEDITKLNPEYEFLKTNRGLAKEYPFELDSFQKAAVVHLERNESVFVAAHTSAGKTVVAEYAIALAMRHVTRTIYTSPIKALSNQKFRDFKITFGSNNVGILTGDVQINAEAPCLIMTTEILRSMLYKGADLIRDVEWVVFDEVHYVSDAERGVVWEEVIIMLPEHVSVILLSATIPNTKEFADWVGRTKRKDIYVISTTKRPVPLEHYLYAGRDIFKIVDSKGEFLSMGYKDAGEALRRKQDKEREAAGLSPAVRVGSRGARGAIAQRGNRGAPGRGNPPSRGGTTTRTTHHQQDKSLFVHLLGLLKKKDLLPTVVFTFSKRRCEEQASTLNNIDLCSAVEKSEIHVALERALLRLSASDKKLPQISRMRELLSRGIGVHHGGLLPIIKEVVEMLFARGLVRILFATETFAMGVNMPARCVVFSGIRKHDGKSFRDILPGEYTQMSGRAGRRGLDSTGVVIILAGDELPEIPTLHKMMLGIPARLQSQFRLTYNMILNLLRVEALRVEEMIKRSFSENASQRLLPDQQKKVTESEKLLGTLPKLTCSICQPSIEKYYDTSAEIIQINQRLIKLASNHPQGVRLLGAGRVVILKDGHFASNIGALLKVAPFQTTTTGLLDHAKVYLVLALVNPETKAHENDKDPAAVPPRWPPRPASLLVNNGEYEVLEVSFASIAMVTSHTVKVDITDIVERHKISAMNDVIARLNGVVHEWISGKLDRVPEIDWNRIRQLEFQELISKREALASELTGMACLECPHFDNDFQILHGEKVLKENIATLRLAISDQNLELLPDYEQRVQVLKELKFIDDNATVLLKGRVACEINSAHELVLTELILENALAAYEPEEVVALLSCFVFQEKTEVEPVMPPKILAGQELIMKIAERIDTVQLRNNVGEDLNARIKFGLVEVVYEWAKGMPFEQITALTDVAEGTIVRVITRLDETCREIRDAARVIGDAQLFKKMEEAQTKIKRDIVFAASLYF